MRELSLLFWVKELEKGCVTGHVRDYDGLMMRF